MEKYEQNLHTRLIKFIFKSLYGLIFGLVFYPLTLLATTQVWDFETTSDYSYDTNEVTITSGNTEGSYTHNDNTSGGFGGADLDNVLWSTDHLELDSTSVNQVSLPVRSNHSLYLRFEESSYNGTSGEVTDSSTLGNDGTNSGSMTTVTGKVGTAADFTGGTYMDGFADTSLPGEGTVMMWLYQSTAASYDYAFSHDDGAGGDRLHIYTYSGRIYARFDSVLINAGVNTLSQWNFVACRYSTSEVSCKVNGEAAVTGSGLSQALDIVGSRIDVGRHANGSYPFYGYIDEIQALSSQLTDDEMDAVYDLQKGNYGGVVDSVIEDSGSASTSWPGLSYITDKPYGKTLPLNGSTETDYASGNVDMSNAVIYLPQDESSGNIYDYSGNGKNCSVTNITRGQEGKFDSSTSHDGNTSRIDCGDSDDFTFSNVSGDLPFSICTWANRDDRSETVMLVTKYQSGNTAGEYTLHINSSNQLIGRVMDSSTLANLQVNGTDFAAGEWHHVCMTYDGSATVGGINLYVDGENVNSTTSTSGVYVQMRNTSYNLYVGNRNDNSNAFDGKMDETVILSKELSQTEVQDIYARGSGTVKFQVRSCDDSSCSGENFVGPDGTGYSFFDPDNYNLNDLTQYNLDVSDNQYFQYRAYLTCEDSSYCPQLSEVSSSSLTSDVAELVDNGGYSTSAQTISNANSAVGYSDLYGFDANISNGEIQISHNNTNWYYWNGSNWTEQAGSGYPTETNTVSEVNENIGQFVSDVGTGSFYFKSFLASPDGSTQASVNNIILDYEAAAAPSNSAPSAPTSIYINDTDNTAQSGQSNPTDLSDLTPEFSAIYNDDDTGDKANKYCIQVNTTSSFDGTDLWFSDNNSCSSGTSITDIDEGNRSIDIEYDDADNDGSADSIASSLSYNTTYYVRIKFWDDDSEEGAWSSANSFKISQGTATHSSYGTQVSSSDIQSNDSNVVMGQFEIASDANGSFDVTEIELTLTMANGSVYTDISNVEIYTDPNGDGDESDGTDLISGDATTFDSSATKFDISDVSLSASDTKYFIVRFDYAGTALAGETFEVNVSDITIENYSGVLPNQTINDASMPTMTVADPTVTLSVDNSTIAEDGSTSTITATLSSASSLDVTVNLSYSGTATYMSDYTGAESSIIILAGNTTGTASVSSMTDSLDESDETIIVDISSVTNGTESGTQQETVTITDDDSAPTVTLSVDTATIDEDGSVSTVTATLSSASGKDVTVNLSYSGTASGSGTDYTASSNSITISAGSTTGTVTLTSATDSLDESDETIIVDISSVTNGTESGTQQETVTITDDDSAPTVSLSVDTLTIDEDGSVSTVTATLSGASGKDVTVNLSYSGTASGSGTDYTASGNSITISAGSTTGTVTLTSATDSLDESDETIIVDISSVTNGTESGTQQETVTITDDDAAPTVTLSVSPSSIEESADVSTITATLSAASSLDVTINLAFSGTATGSGTDYTASSSSIIISAGNTTGTATVTSVVDSEDEDGETVIIDIDSVTNGTENGTQQETITINDQITVSLYGHGSSLGSQETSEDTYRVTEKFTIEAGPESDVVIETLTIETTLTGTSDISTTGTLYVQTDTNCDGGGADRSNKYAAALSSTSEVIDITDVTISAGSTQCFILMPRFGAGVGGSTIEMRVSDFTTNLSSNNIVSSQNISTVTYADPQITFSTPSPTGIYEDGETSSTYTVNLAYATVSDVTVEFSYSGTATFGTDYTTSLTDPYQITIPAGNTSGTFTVTAVDDAIYEGNTTVRWDISSVTNATEATTQYKQIYLYDDEALPQASISFSPTSITEGNTTTITATIDKYSEKDTTIYLGKSGEVSTSSDLSGYVSYIIIPAGSLTANSTYTATDDNIYEGDEIFTVYISSVTNGEESGVQSQDLTIVDGDTVPTISLVFDSVTSMDEDRSLRVNAQLSHAIDETISADLAFSGTAIKGTDYTVSAESFTWTTGQTSKSFYVYGVPDDIYETSEDFTISLTNYSTVTAGTESVAGSINDNNTLPTVSLSSDISTMSENGGVITITATLSSEMSFDETVSLSLGGTATGSGTDYTQSASSITILSGSTTGTITLTGVDDSLYEGDETISVSISSTDYATGSGDPLSLTISEDDSGPTVSLSTDVTSISEDGSVATITATLSASSGVDTTIDLGFSGTATGSGTDYTPSGSQIVISAGDSTGTITLTSVSDSLSEADETIIVDIDSVTNGTENGDQQVTVSITNDDSSPSISLSVDNSSIAEESGSATVTATISEASGQDVTVNLDYSGTAVRTTDYSSTATQITISAGQTTGTVGISSIDDSLDEDDETIIVSISSVDNAQELSDQSVTITMVDNESLPTITLSISKTTLLENEDSAVITATISEVSGRDITLGFTNSGTASDSGVDYSVNSSMVISAGDLTATMNLSSVQDNLDEDDETITIDLSSVDYATESSAQQVSATITDDDDLPELSIAATNSSVSEDGETASFVASIGSVSGRDVTVNLDISGTATGSGTDYSMDSTSITIPEGSTQATLSITLIDDSLDEDDETIIATISSVTNSTESASNTATITIVDDESIGVNISGADSLILTEGNDEITDTFTVVLNAEPLSDVTIDLSLDNDEITISPAQLVFTSENWDTLQTITISQVDDDVAEGNHTSSIQFNVVSDDEDYAALEIEDLVVNITDDESAGLSIIQSGNQTSVEESGTQDTIGFVLTSEPESNVTVRITTTNQLESSSTTVEFTSENWDQVQEIEIDAADDSRAEGDSTETISFTIISDDANYASLEVDSISVNVTDNEVAGVQVLASSSSTQVSENGDEDNFTIRLTSQPSSRVVINIDHDDEISVDQDQIVFTSQNWNTAVSINVEAIDDNLVESRHSSTITFSSTSDDSNYSNVRISNLLVSIEDNDTAEFVMGVNDEEMNITSLDEELMYSVVLNSQPQSNVSLDISVEEGLIVSPSQLVFTSENWNEVQIVSIVLDSEIDEYSDQIEISHEIATNDTDYTDLEIDNIVVTVDLPEEEVTDEEGGSGGTTISRVQCGARQYLESETAIYTLNASRCVDFEELESLSCTYLWNQVGGQLIDIVSEEDQSMEFILGTGHETSMLVFLTASCPNQRINHLFRIDPIKTQIELGSNSKGEIESEVVAATAQGERITKQQITDDNGDSYWSLDIGNNKNILSNSEESLRVEFTEIEGERRIILADPSYQNESGLIVVIDPETIPDSISEINLDDIIFSPVLGLETVTGLRLGSRMGEAIHALDFANNHYIAALVPGSDYGSIYVFDTESLEIENIIHGSENERLCSDIFTGIDLNGDNYMEPIIGISDSCSSNDSESNSNNSASSVKGIWGRNNLASVIYVDEDSEIEIDIQNEVSQIKTGNLNGDGYDDMFVCSLDGTSCYIIFGEENSHWEDIVEPDEIINFSNRGSLRNIAIADLSGDGIDDIAISFPQDNDGDGSIQVILGQDGSNGINISLENSVNIGIDDDVEISNLIAGDYDQDGSIDLYMVTTLGRTLVMNLNESAVIESNEDDLLEEGANTGGDTPTASFASGGAGGGCSLTSQSSLNHSAVFMMIMFLSLVGYLRLRRFYQ